jgi:hypothetical protein
MRETFRAAGVLRWTTVEWRTTPAPALVSVRRSLPAQTGQRRRWYIAVPHQRHRWKRRASEVDVPFGAESLPSMSVAGPTPG